MAATAPSSTVSQDPFDPPSDGPDWLIDDAAERAEPEEPSRSAPTGRTGPSASRAGHSLEPQAGLFGVLDRPLRGRAYETESPGRD